MKIYMAPLEGVTGFIYRNAHAKHFGEMDKYFTPFISPNMHKKLTPREKNDVIPEHNQGLYVVPQILTNNAEYFIAIAEQLKEIGYGEVNLNLGCPSPTVVTKGKGSGFLGQPEKLDQFLEEIYTKLEMKISVKTRIGFEDAAEHERLIAIFNKYPMEELIIHPRIQKDFYKNDIRIKEFENMNKEAIMPVCYNGDINTVVDYEKIYQRFPDVERIMLGRGLMQNPNLSNLIKLKEGEIGSREQVSRERIESFLNDIFDGYRELMGEDRNALFRMKELWSYLIKEYPGNEKTFKKLKKAQTATAYKSAVIEILKG
jgi:tRNA-dihydrouridine synthase